jgi:SAM-dependent methyltransferase
MLNAVALVRHRTVASSRFSSGNPFLDHYALNSDVLRRINDGFHKKGKTREDATLKDLAAIDEFHIGGVPAANSLFEKLSIRCGDVVLDVGCGLGGPARVCASKHSCSVVGVDLNPEFVTVGNELSSWPRVALRDRVTLCEGDATTDLNAALSGDSVDSAYMLHVGMNIHDKDALARSIYQALKPGGRFGCFDVMGPVKATGNPLLFPLPFASGPDSCALATVDEYKAIFERAGFKLKYETDKLDFVTASVETVLQKLAAFASKNNRERPPLSLAVVMGSAFEKKLENSLLLFQSGEMTAHELVWGKPA